MTWKKAVVTGGVGSIGSELVRKLLSDGTEEVMVLDIDEIRMFQFKKTINDDRLKCCVADIRDSDSIKRGLSQMGDIDVIFHTAALKHVVICEQNPLEASLTNIIGTQRIVDAAIERNVPSCVLISTDKAADPINVLGATKLVAEKIFLDAAKKHKNNFSIVRFGNVANSRGSVIPVLVDSLLHRKEIIITNPDVTRFIMRIEDAVGLIFKSLEISLGGEVFVLKMQSFRLGDLVDVLVNYAAPEVGIRSNDIVVRTTELVRGEKMHERLFAEDEVKSVVDLGALYAIIDDKSFPKHKKYLQNNSTQADLISSDEVPKVPRSILESIVLEYLTTLLGDCRGFAR
jgi:FlaA1/EpsC-like NDP-sugar epimerase